MVTEVGILYSDIFTLLTSFIFDGDLCLHKDVYELDEEFNMLYLSDEDLENFQFFNSGLSQNQYYIKYISTFSNYEKFLESAILYYLEYSIKNNALVKFMNLFSGILNADEMYTPFLYNHMKNINIFSTFTLESLQGLLSNYSDSTISFLVFTDKNSFLKIEKRNALFCLINAFSFYFSLEFRSTRFTDCQKTESYIPMFLALKIYKINLLTPGLSLDELKKHECIDSLQEKIIFFNRFNRMSKKTIDDLIEKNWRYHNYE